MTAQQSKYQSKYPILEYETQTMIIIMSYVDEIQSRGRSIQAKIIIVPKVRLYNAPLEIELKGVYSIEDRVEEEERSNVNSALEITESYIFQREEKVQKKDLITEKEQNESKVQQVEKGQQFLQGCQVLYQLDQKSKKRLQILQQKLQYLYPIQFDLPQNLPHSLDQLILNHIHLSVKYQLNVSIRSIIVENNKKSEEYYVLPFTVLPQVKTYPYEQLAIKQKIKCYHEHGATSQKSSLDKSNSYLGCLSKICPKGIFELMRNSDKVYSGRFDNYDLHHLQLVVVVSQNSNIFMIARAYKQPDEKMMSIVRDKRLQQALYKQMNSLAQMPQGNMKQSQLQHLNLRIRRVQVEMHAELQGYPRQLIFKKTIILNNITYDMIQGEIMINLDQYLPFPKSYKSDLFTLTYDFKMKGLFNDDEEIGLVQFEDLVVEQIKKELLL